MRSPRAGSSTRRGGRPGPTRAALTLPKQPKKDAAAGFAAYLARRGLDGFDREVALIPGRRLRWDIVHHGLKIAVEIQGGIWSGGAHARPKGIQRDAEKLNLCVLAGYRPLFFTTDDLAKDPEGCIDIIRRVGLLRID